ncbi:hypothetical protein ACUR5C_00065 [Aliikangiella sp. IMCC44653]
MGYSLIELIITITLTTLVMVLFYTVFSQSQARSVTPVMQIKAAQLAQAYLEEISLRRFDENSPAGNGQRCNSPGQPSCSATLGSDGETRDQFDDIDDYNGLSDSPPRDALNNPRSGFNNYQTSVNVSYAGGDFGLAAQDLKKIEISITTPTGQSFVFSDYRSNF